ncbi:MAG TPA: tyrosine-type recombinase/integrase [Ktedonobacteraceae bacterium]|nr:tyrosine-type recombinase/integrase [Ktedonobacteraceae bacterium]
MTQQTTFQKNVLDFLQELVGGNKSQLTLTAYKTDLLQFFTWLSENDVTVTIPSQVTRGHVNEYLAFLSSQGRSGVTRARKLAALKSFFTYLKDEHLVILSPADTIHMPNKERKKKVVLRTDEYSRMLSEAGGNPRDFSILQLFLQTGIRVSELIAITLEDLDIQNHVLKVHGKGNKEREIPLEKKSVQAVKSYLMRRPESQDQHLFLNYSGEGLSIRGVRKIVDKYLKKAGITKRISCHGLRRTFGSAKAGKGMNAFQLQKLMGHERITTTIAYVEIGQEELRRAMEATSL